jgi:hypothetical protein
MSELPPEGSGFLLLRDNAPITGSYVLSTGVTSDGPRPSVLRVFLRVRRMFYGPAYPVQPPTFGCQGTGLSTAIVPQGGAAFIPALNGGGFPPPKLKNTCCQGIVTEQKDEPKEIGREDSGSPGHFTEVEWLSLGLKLQGGIFAAPGIRDILQVIIVPCGSRDYSWIWTGPSTPTTAR